MNKILITTSNFDTSTPEIQALEQQGYAIVLNPHGRRLSEEEAKDLITPEIVGMIAGVEPLTRAVIEGTENLQVISRCGTGMDSVDLEAAKEKGIAVYNTPQAPADAVAELAIGLILDCLRQISFQGRALRDGGWERPKGGLLGARTLGLIGFGHIGSRVARIAKSFGSNILVYDAYAQGKNSDIATFVELDELLEKSDIISLHIPYSNEVHHMMNADRIGQMKEGAILINTARGGLVDEDALYKALKSGHLSAAGLDVFEEEPYNGPLTMLDNAVLSAHTGSYAIEARARQEAEAAQNLFIALRERAEKDGTHG